MWSFLDTVWPRSFDSVCDKLVTLRSGSSIFVNQTNIATNINQNEWRTCYSLTSGSQMIWNQVWQLIGRIDDRSYRLAVKRHKPQLYCLPESGMPDEIFRYLHKARPIFLANFRWKYQNILVLSCNSCSPRPWPIRYDTNKMRNGICLDRGLLPQPGTTFVVC